VNTKNQIGSAHSVLVIILVASLLFALGFIFVQNFVVNTDESQNASIDSDGAIPTKTDTDQSVINNEPEVALKTAKISKDFGVNLSFSYPEDWTLSRKTTGEKLLSERNTGEEVITITSPNKSYSVLYNIGANGGLGGACDPDSQYKIKTFSYETLDNFSSAIFYSGVSGEEEEYKSYAGLMTSVSLDGEKIDYYSKMKVGDSVCDIYLKNLIGLDSSRENFNVVALDMSIQAKGMANNRITGKQDGFKNFNNAKQVLTGEDYEQAKEILLSTTLNQ